MLSFDLPEHGERKDEETLCNVQNGIKELTIIMQYAKEHWNHISVFANSIGAYFTLMSYANEPIEKAWFLSPVVDMLQLIERMMMWFQVSKEQLEKEQAIATPIGQTLYWDYYCYVKEHPIVKWDTPTNILYGSEDDTCEYETIWQFTNCYSCNLEVLKGGEHFFHTPIQLQTYKDWLEKGMC